MHGYKYQSNEDLISIHQTLSAISSSIYMDYITVDSFKPSPRLNRLKVFLTLFLCGFSLNHI